MAQNHYGAKQNPYGTIHNPYGKKTTIHAGKTNPYGKKINPFAGKTSPFGSITGNISILELEDWGLVLTENTGFILLENSSPAIYSGMASPYGKNISKYTNSQTPFIKKTSPYNQ